MKLNNPVQKFIQNISKTLSRDPKLWNCNMKTGQTLDAKGTGTDFLQRTPPVAQKITPRTDQQGYIKCKVSTSEESLQNRRKITSHSSNRRLTSKYKEIRNTKGTNKPINSWANELSFQKKYKQPVNTKTIINNNCSATLAKDNDNQNHIKSPSNPPEWISPRNRVTNVAE